MKCIYCGMEMPLDGRHCTCMLGSTTKVKMPPVKEPRKSIGGLTVECNVETSQIDEALDKAKELVGVLEKIDGLTGRIVRDIEKINAYALGRHI